MHIIIDNNAWIFESFARELFISFIKFNNEYARILLLYVYAKISWAHISLQN